MTLVRKWEVTGKLDFSTMEHVAALGVAVRAISNG